MLVPVFAIYWVVPVALAFGSMTLTVGLITLVSWLLLGLPLGAAVLLGAVLAPTDPVLASDVQVDEPTDRDRLRFSLTAEAGLNDGTAFPFVMLGLGLLGLHEIGEWGWRWWAVDVVWAIGAGLAVGALLGTLVGDWSSTCGRSIGKPSGSTTSWPSDSSPSPTASRSGRGARNMA